MPAMQCLAGPPVRRGKENWSARQALRLRARLNPRRACITFQRIRWHMNETLATMMAGISHLDKEAREAHRLRLLLDDVVLWLRSVNIQDINVPP